VNHYDEIIKLLDEANVVMAKVDESFQRMQRGGVINTSVGIRGLVGNLQRANKLGKKVDALLTYVCANCGKRVRTDNEGNWIHFLPQKLTKEQEENKAFINFKLCDWDKYIYTLPPADAKKAVPLSTPEDEYTEEQREMILKRTTELRDRYVVYLKLIEAANEAAKGMVTMAPKAAAGAAVDTAKSIKDAVLGKKEEPKPEEQPKQEGV
jgi:hypothetical protein